MTDSRPDFVLADAEWKSVIVRFNGVPVSLFRSEADPNLVKGWADNPRTEMAIKRWRNQHHRSNDAFPDDEEMLRLMLEDDQLATAGNESFSIKELGEDILRNGVREEITITWDGILLDGNRRKFAAMWALSEVGDSSPGHRALVSRIPVHVVPDGATEAVKQAIIIQENYAYSLKKAWPEVVTNRRVYERFRSLSQLFPNDTELEIRQKLTQEFPRFGATEIRNRVETWLLTEEFRADQDDDEEDDTERLINDRFQYFRQAHDTFRNRGCYQNSEFKDLVFHGIKHQLFPNFAAVREIEDIFNSDDASETFRLGEGMTTAQKRAHFRLARDQAGRERAETEQTIGQRILGLVLFLDGLTSEQISQISDDQRKRLEDTLSRVIAQSEAA